MLTNIFVHITYQILRSSSKSHLKCVVCVEALEETLIGVINAAFP